MTLYKCGNVEHRLQLQGRELCSRNRTHAPLAPEMEQGAHPVPAPGLH
eukprot:CAMPEP_0180518178 /NCGR_PEP_ID=MMETSP1036_2-20121128/54947_1 /TAXON_ID=632150 /ORGANISM="Azadinium spinosum, Strain 3D9" /LENGTH=47 /DNA_ID= /DNA_START= /DNA_END= /DNA_ORIENTATION=